VLNKDTLGEYAYYEEFNLNGYEFWNPIVDVKVEWYHHVELHFTFRPTSNVMIQVVVPVQSKRSLGNSSGTYDYWKARTLTHKSCMRCLASRVYNSALAYVPGIVYNAIASPNDAKNLITSRLLDAYIHYNLNFDNYILVSGKTHCHIKPSECNDDDPKAICNLFAPYNNFFVVGKDTRAVSIDIITSNNFVDDIIMRSDLDFGIHHGSALNDAITKYGFNITQNVCRHKLSDYGIRELLPGTKNHHKYSNQLKDSNHITSGYLPLFSSFLELNDVYADVLRSLNMSTNMNRMAVCNNCGALGRSGQLYSMPQLRSIMFSSEDEVLKIPNVSFLNQQISIKKISATDLFLSL
jgi:hypothetical protein